MKTKFKTLTENEEIIIKEIFDNKNFRNNQKYIIDENTIDKKLKYSFGLLDKIEERYTYLIFLRIIFSFIFLIFVFFISVNLEQNPIYGETLLLIFSMKGFFVILSILSLIYVFYNSFLFYKKSFYFFPRRKRKYTVIKYSPLKKSTKIIKKNRKGTQN